MDMDIADGRRFRNDKYSNQPQHLSETIQFQLEDKNIHRLQQVRPRVCNDTGQPGQQ